MAYNSGSRPTGRQRNGGGMGQSVHTHGPGLGTGPVGKADAYEGRRNGSGGYGGGGGSRAGGGKGKLLLIAAVLILLLGGGGAGISGLFGGGDDGPVVTNPPAQPQQQSSIDLSSFLGGYQGSSAISDGAWTGKNNTGKLNTASSGAKRTVLYGDGRDAVTVMVYLCGTDLESKSGMASADLREMANADLGKNVNLLIYSGGCKKWKTQGISNSVHQIWQIQNGKLRLLEKSFLEGKAMTDPAALSGFIRYCDQYFPANRNILVLWDHGGGSVSGYGYDETKVSAGSMSLSAVSKALTAGGVSFDFIGFDACLMATVETALTLAPSADYLIASEETEPGIGWYHTRWLSALGKDPAIDTPTLGKIIADDFVQVCSQQCPGQKATLSVTDLAELSAAVPDRLKSFAQSTANAIKGGDYAKVSRARGSTREFGSSKKLDQIDLVHLSLLLNTGESRALADALLSAVKYNRVASGITDAYGLAAYFPYRSAGRVSSAVTQLNAMGFDRDYTACMRTFATLEVTGQAAGGGSDSPFGSLFGSGASVGSVGDLVGSLLGGSGASAGVGDVVGSLLGGSGGSILGSLLGDASVFDRSISEETLVETVEDARLSAPLQWTEKNGRRVLSLPEAEWAKVADLQLNVFLDDGRGYIDLGLDTIFDFTEDGDLIGEYDGMWVALNRQPVAYYFEDQTEVNGVTVIRGRVPVLLNGERAELLIVFRDGEGEVSGAQYIYKNGETDTVAKAAALAEGDVIQPICDRYTYGGSFEDAYMLGGALTYAGEGSIAVSDVTLNPADGRPVAAYMFTDRFASEHWTPAME